MATNFIALYRGESLQDVKLVHATSNKKAVRRYCETILDDLPEMRKDPSLSALADGQRRALKAILEEK